MQLNTMPRELCAKNCRIRDDRRWYARACQNSSKCWAPNTKKCQVAKLPGGIIFGCSRLVSHNHFSHRGNTWCVCVTSICVTMKTIENIHRLAHALAIHRGKLIRKLMKTDDRSVLNLNTSTPAWSRWHFFWHKKNRGIAFYQNADRLGLDLGNPTEATKDDSWMLGAKKGGSMACLVRNGSWF